MRTLANTRLGSTGLAGPEERGCGPQGRLPRAPAGLHLLLLIRRAALGEAARPRDDGDVLLGLLWDCLPWGPPPNRPRPGDGLLVGLVLGPAWWACPGEPSLLVGLSWGPAWWALPWGASLLMGLVLGPAWWALPWGAQPPGVGPAWGGPAWWAPLSQALDGLLVGPVWASLVGPVLGAQPPGGPCLGGQPGGPCPGSPASWWALSWGPAWWALFWGPSLLVGLVLGANASGGPCPGASLLVGLVMGASLVGPALGTSLVGPVLRPSLLVGLVLVASLVGPVLGPSLLVGHVLGAPHSPGLSLLCGLLRLLTANPSPLTPFKPRGDSTPRAGV